MGAGPDVTGRGTAREACAGRVPRTGADGEARLPPRGGAPCLRAAVDASVEGNAAGRRQEGPVRGNAASVLQGRREGAASVPSSRESPYAGIYFGPCGVLDAKSQSKWGGKGAVPGSPIVLAGRARTGPG